MKFVDITGHRFGKLTALYRTCTQNRHYKWRCRCECGKEKDIQGGHLRSGHTTSCGCSWYKFGGKHQSWKGYNEISGRFFKSILHNAKVRNLPVEITIEELWDLFISQDKKCALTNLPIEFEANHGRIKGIASLDRIDSSKGYIKGNIQWVHSTINNMKWDMPQEEFIRFCKLVTIYKK